MSEKRIPGCWWVRGRSGRVAYGVLRFAPEEGVTLETVNAHPVSCQENSHPFVHLDLHDILVGRDCGDRPISLFFPVRLDKSSNSVLDAVTHHIRYALLGHEFRSWRDVQFQKVQFNFTNLDDWISTAELKVESGERIFGHGWVEEKVFEIEPGLQVAILPGRSSSVEVGSGEPPIANHLIEFRWDTPIHIEKCEYWISALGRLLSLAIGTTCCLSSWTGFLLQTDGVCSLQPVEVLRTNLDFGPAPSNTPRPKMLFAFDDVKESFGELIRRWTNYSSSSYMGGVLDLYFDVVRNTELELKHRFLFLSHALVQYHAATMSGRREPDDSFSRRIHAIRSAISNDDYRFIEDGLLKANQKTGYERLTELVQHRRHIIGSLADNFPWFPRLVENTRRYFTSLDSGLRNRDVADGLDLMRLVEAMQRMLEVLFMSDLRVGRDAIDRAISGQSAVAG